MTSDWSVLLIGGSVAVGKSTAAKRIATVSGATLLQADDIRLALRLSTVSASDAALPQFKEIAGCVSDALEAVIAHHLVQADKIVIEGVWITPDLAARSTYGAAAAGARRRAVFVLEDARERPEPISPFESALVRWLRAETKRLSLPIVPARPVGHLAERILAVL